MIAVCHVSGRISRNPALTEERAAEMAVLLPHTIFFYYEEPDD